MLLSQYPISCIAGHEHIAPERKKDPGEGFDWRYLQHGVGLKATYFPAELGLI
jgi:AmpD protein